MTFYIDVNGYLYIKNLFIYRNTNVHSGINFLGGNVKGRVVLFKIIHKVREVVTVLKPCLDWSVSQFRSGLSQTLRAT